jgi:transcriptional regulator PpsR
MNGVSIAQPDITLLLDMDGVIREATFSSTLSDEGVGDWIGRPWDETVADVGGEKVRRMVEDARTSRVSVFRQITQCLPSGRELLMEYTTVRLGGKAGLLAIGRNLQAVAELQSRLIAAQQAMERDYWKLRDIETRYRLLFDASNEAVLLLRATTFQIMEANPAALRALGISPVGRDFLDELAPDEGDSFQAMVLRVREQGKAPGILIHLGPNRDPWLVRALLMPAEPGAVLLLQLTPAGIMQAEAQRTGPVSITKLIERGPDGFVVIDREGIILRANDAFLDLAQVGAVGSVVDQRLGRWLGRPGADLKILIDNVLQYGLIRLFPTTIHGELGTDTEVEISATGNTTLDPHYIGLVIRDVGGRLPASRVEDKFDHFLDPLTPRIGKTPLRRLVKDTTRMVEQHYIEAALERTGGNRTAAADLLGLSRQTLYVKLHQYGLETNSPTTPAQND